MQEPKTLVVTSSRTPNVTGATLLAALEVADVGVRAIDVGKSVAVASNATQRVVQAFSLELSERRLVQEIEEYRPDVVVAFDPKSCQLLGHIRAETEVPFVLVSVVGQLQPNALWGETTADRYLVCDDESAYALGKAGVDTDLVWVTGYLGEIDFSMAGKKKRLDMKAKFNLPKTVPAILVAVYGMDDKDIQDLILQLSLLGPKAVYLFDAGKDEDAASIVRRRVREVDLRAKLFGVTSDRAYLWRASDAVVAPTRAKTIARILMVNTPWVGLGPSSPGLRALMDRELAAHANTSVLVGPTLNDIVNKKTPRRGVGVDGAKVAAEAIYLLCRSKNEVLKEGNSFGDSKEPAYKTKRESPQEGKRMASGLEDLGGSFNDDIPSSKRSYGDGHSSGSGEGYGIENDLDALKKRAAASKNVRINSELERLKNKIRSKK